MNQKNDKKTKDVLGVDFGGVVTDRASADPDTAFRTENYLATAATPGAFDALRRLVAERFGANVYFVSKCGPRVERRTRDWLTHHDVFARTGIPEGNIRFCRRREDKAPICAALGVSHFVDDRASVLRHLTTVGTTYLFRPEPRERALAERLGLAARRVDGWDEILADLLG